MKAIKWLLGMSAIAIAVWAMLRFVSIDTDLDLGGRWRGAGEEGAAVAGEASGDKADDDASPAPGDDDDDEPAPSRVEKVDGLVAVRLTPEEQRQTGVRVAALLETTHASELLAAGSAMDLEALLTLRASYHAARAEAEVIRTSLTSTARNLERLRALHREDANVSARQVQEAEAQAATDRARLAAAEQRLRDLRSEAIQRWGEALAGMALADDAQGFDRFIDHQDMLLLVTLRPGQDLPAGRTTIFVGPTGQRDQAREATLVSAAPLADPVVPGETYFFRTDAGKLRVGMRMDAWIPTAAEPHRGVEVPGSAVIWYAGRLWVYLKAGEDLFLRRMLSGHEETREGWFVAEGLKAGEQVVVSGAQMLFSEEFRTRIPSEDEK